MPMDSHVDVSLSQHVDLINPPKTDSDAAYMWFLARDSERHKLAKQGRSPAGYIPPHPGCPRTLHLPSPSSRDMAFTGRIHTRGATKISSSVKQICGGEILLGFQEMCCNIWPWKLLHIRPTYRLLSADVATIPVMATSCPSTAPGALGKYKSDYITPLPKIHGIKPQFLIP